MSCIYGSESRNAFNHTHKLKYTFRPLTQITADSPKKCWVTVWSGRMWNTLFSNTICSNAPILCTTANKERFSFSYWTVKFLSIWLFSCMLGDVPREIHFLPSQTVTNTRNMFMLSVSLPHSPHFGAHHFIPKVLIFCSHSVWLFCYITSQ